jgi:RNA polymerase sigma-70 factor (ECF subfamily)
MRTIRRRRDADAQTDEDRFDALYREYYSRVLAYALRRTTADVASDVVADTFLVAWRRLERVPDEPLPWLLGVARKTLANSRRTARRRAALIERVAAQEGAERLVDVEADAVGATTIAEALERLPGRDQELLALIAWEKLSVADAATVLGLSAPTCRMRLQRARRRLAGELVRAGIVRAAGRDTENPPRPVKEQTG